MDRPNGNRNRFPVTGGDYLETSILPQISQKEIRGKATPHTKGCLPPL